ncbi:MAG TPA: O-antigen ligase family protein [Candidatus Limnocylindria bacterium]|nr:O-antigen ligase family protein [Candidatus Limnocylindria bacterium]
MTFEARPAGAPEITKLQARARHQARKLSGGLMAVLGAGFAIAVVAAFTLLDYKFEQDPHRLVKILLGLAAMGVILMRPWIGLFLLPIATPFLPWMPKLPIPGLNPLNVLVLGIFLPWGLTRVMNHEQLFRPSRLGLVIGLLIGLGALSIVRGAAFPTGYEYDPADAALWLFRGAMTFTIFYITMSMARGAADRKLLAWAIAIALLLESVVTYAYGKSGSGGRAEGSFGQPNELGTFLAIFTVFTAAIALGSQRFWARAVLFATTVAGAIATLMTLSRGAMIALALGLMLVALRSSRLLAAALVLALLASPWWAPQDVRERVLATQEEAEDSDDVQLEGSAQIRIDTWNAILKVVSEHPIDGVGFVGLAWVLPETGGELGIEVKDSAHNTYLRLLAELGVFGLLLLLLLFWQCWSLGSEGMRRARTRFDRQLALGLCAATVALAVSCWFGDRFFPIIITGNFWMLCALVDDLVAERREAAT